ncbi:MAG: DUF3450 domain-containing protein [Deltaproteobacteria bacterium]|nr:DUF3450 domain-containing protein [Deltaproteobacteria bacterium]
MKNIAFILICATAFFCFFEIRPVFSENFPAQVKKPVNESITIRRKTQKAEDKWAEERSRLKAKYEKLESENNRLTAENSELKKDVAARRASVEALEREIAQIARISDELLPFLEQTYNRLAALVKEDVPFLSDERDRRLETLRRTLDDAMVSTSEKFRKVMEALSVEAEYGNTVEVYPEEIVIDGKKIQVNIFRLGKISLFFQTLDGKTTGYFDAAAFAWKKFPPQYNRQINAAIEMGTKQRPVDLLVLPLGRLVTK